jgi:Zn-dependent protease
MAAVILHEIAHGLVAYWRGDPTAYRAGRLTLNPLPHIDPFGTLLLPALLIAAHSPFLFGYARPVPVNFRQLYRPKRDMVLVAAAGPVTNLVLAGLSALLLRAVFAPDVPLAEQGPLVLIAMRSVLINVVLAIFNLVPVPPLDGGRVLTGLLPLRQAIAFSRVEPYGMFIVVALLATDVLGRVVGPVVDVVLRVLL